MSTIWKWVAGFLAALALVCGVAAGWQTHVAGKAQKTAQETQKKLEATTLQLAAEKRTSAALGAALSTQKTVLVRVQVSQSKSEKELSNALEANRSWADVPVPADVVRSLQHGTDASSTAGAAE